MRLFAVLLIVMFAVPAGAAQFSSLEEKMSEQEFHEAGLDKLSPEELERLNGWLRGKLGTTLANPAAAGSVGFRPVDFGTPAGTERVAISSRTVGSFSGWDKGTRIELENGQIWKVTDEASELAVPSQLSPIINIEPGTLGSWLMSVDGYNAVARVTRVK